MRNVTLPLRLKVLAMTVGVASLGIIVGALLLLTDQRHSARQSLLEGAHALAGTVAANLAGPLTFEDAEGASELLAHLRENPSVRSATLYDGQGLLFAAYHKERAPRSETRLQVLLERVQSQERLSSAADDSSAAIWSAFAGERLDTFAPVRVGQRQIGTLHVRTSARQLVQRMQRATLITACVSLLLIVICGLVAARLQRFIVVPVQRLVSAMEDISRGGALTVRVQRPDQDELAALFSGFNAMLSELSARGIERDAHAARLSSLLEASPDLVLVVDEEGSVVELLTPKHALLVADDRFALGHALDESMSAAASLELKAGLRRALSERRVLRLELELEAESEPRWIEAVLVPLPLPEPKLGARLLVSARDVSERRKLEAQLRQAQKMEAVGQLAGGVAHDFNNLLAGIIGFTELLRERREPAEIRELSDKVLATADRAADLVAGLLAFSRRGPREVKPVDLNELIVRVTQILERTLDRRIQIVLRLSPHHCRTEGDPAQLESALLNLGVNARDAMPNGGKLTFSSQIVSDSGVDRYVEVSVGDTGTGIEQHVLAHIFEPFFTTKGPGKGSGLGLAAVYGTVQAHGGITRVESQLGVGTVFRLYLPHTDREPLSSLPPRVLSRGAGHILLADDEESVRESVAALLRELGYRVTVVQNGRDAVREHEAGSESFQLTILDMSMPELAGPEAAAQIRALNPRARILLSSGNSKLSEVELLALPIDGFLQKPFRSEELSQKVAQLLQGPTQEGAQSNEAAARLTPDQP